MQKWFKIDTPLGTYNPEWVNVAYQNSTYFLKY